ncbi:MAG: peptidoglycan DD-metalloendopeptidase family protein [Clostridiales bacterium]|nr:peptidoglycan DD-metalloendopeptidase family protein [Candidatus Equinaster intestinalis]
MKKPNFKRIISVFLLIAIFVTVFSASISVSAASNSSEIDKLNKEISQLKKRINDNKSNLSKQNDVKKDLDAKITATQKKINLVTSQINQTKAEIAKSEAKIREKNSEIADTKELFKKRLYTLYTTNTGNTLQFILGAESFDDLLIRTELIKCMTTQDDDLLGRLNAAISDINAEIKKNNARKKELEKSKADLALDKAELNEDIEDVNGVIKSINKDISSDQKEIKTLNNYLDSLLYDNTEVDIDFAGMFVWPVPGQYRVSCEFDSHDPLHPTGHNGMDIMAPMGARIVSAAKGQVTKYYNSCTHNYKKYSSCGCGGGFGNHVRINHGLYNGHYYLTIYGHMTNVASGIKTGTMVNQGQTIGYVGTTGFSTGYHCHFAVAWSSKSNAAQGYAGTYLDPRRFIK